jgi:large subunit ribosomal protein L3
MAGLIGRKVGMTQVFDKDGRVVPVTVIEAGPCKVVEVRTPERDGYSAVQLGFGEKPARLISKPVMGHLKKQNAGTLRVLREFRSKESFEVGQTLEVTQFEAGQLVDVIGTSIGKGFQGVIKRHKFHGGDEAHGCKTKRMPGSVGASAYPNRVIKGKKLPGRMGGDRVTAKNLLVVSVDAENKLLLVRGAVPGSENGLLLIRKSGEKRSS